VAPRLSRQTPIFGGVFFVSTPRYGMIKLKGQKKLEFYPESLGAMLKY